MADRRWLAAVLVVCAACDPLPMRRAHPSVRASATARASASAALSAAPGPPIDPEARDPLDLMRIAESHRAAELFGIAESRLPERTAALLSLRYADDVELVLGRLAELAADRRRDDRRDLLAVLRDVAYRRRDAREPLDPDSLAKCIAALDGIARDAKDDSAVRALATSALHGFARAGVVAEAAIATLEPSAGPAPSPAPSAARAPQPEP
jgi:hypothetical protein